MKEGLILKIFVCHAGDTDREVKAIMDVCRIFSLDNPYDIHLVCSHYSDNSPSVGTPQTKIDKDIKENAGVLIAVLKNNLGSGNLEHEIKDLGLKEFDPDSFGLFLAKRASEDVKFFVGTIENDCQYKPFNSVAELKYEVLLFLMKVIKIIMRGQSPEIISIAADRNEIEGRNFDETCQVVVNGDEINTIERRPDRIIISPDELPESGVVYVKKGQLESNKISFHAVVKQYSAVQEVVETEIKLFRDSKGKDPVESFKGVILRMHELGGLEYLRVVPVHEDFSLKKGDYVAHGGEVYAHRLSVGETWFKDPFDGKIKYAWTGSSIFIGDKIGHVGGLKTASVELLPTPLEIETKNLLFLSVLAEVTDGLVSKIKDVTNESKIVSDDDSIASIDHSDNRVIHGNAIGNTLIRASYEKLHSRREVSVYNPTPGYVRQIFNGGLQGEYQIRRYQGLVVSPDNWLYFVNQGNRIYRLNLLNGLIEIFIELPEIQGELMHSATASRGMDNLCYADGYIYFSTLRPRELYRVSTKIREVEIVYRPEAGGGVPKGVAVDSNGIIYLATMENEIVKIEHNRKVSRLPIQIHSVFLSLLNDEKIVVSSAGGGSRIDLYSTDDGSLLNSIDGKGEASSGLASFNGRPYIEGFSNGCVKLIDFENGKFLPIADGLPTIGGITFDKLGNLYVTAFDARDFQDLGIYKIYRAGDL